MVKKANHLTPYETVVTRQARSALKGHQPAVLWFTGLSGSGKSTIANRVEHILNQTYKAHTYLLDGDILRGGLNADLGFSLPDRSENIRRVGEAAKLLADAGLIVLTAFISPLRRDREKCRNLLAGFIFIEIFTDCPLEKCEERDAKGLYKKARAGEISDFTGISSPFEAPQTPEIMLPTADQTVEWCADQVINYLKEKSIISDG